MSPEKHGEPRRIGLPEINRRFVKTNNITIDTLAGFMDYYRLQGGIPIVEEFKDGKTKIRHLYGKGRALFPKIDKPIHEYGIVKMGTEEGDKFFARGLLRSEVGAKE